MDKPFTVALRGCDITRVDRLLDRVHSALASDDHRLRASMANELRSAESPQRLRGYDRASVDRAVEDLLRELT